MYVSLFASFSEHGKLDGSTREDLFRANTELKTSQSELAAAIATNNMLRLETKKYHAMRRKIEINNQTFVDRVNTYETSLMDELQATSELYELHYNPVVREVASLENNIVDTLRISSEMFSHLNVFDPIDIRRLQMKCTADIRNLLPFKHLNLVEFESLIDQLKLEYWNVNDVICYDQGTFKIEKLKCSKLCTILVVIIVKIIFISSFLF